MAMVPERNFTIAGLAILGILASQAMSLTLHEASMRERHEKWMARHGRNYEDSAEKERRFEIFKDNVKFIENFNNAGNRSYTLNINEFADRTVEEFRAFRTGFSLPFVQVPFETTPFRYESVTDVPSSIDWRKRGAVTPIKNQYHCGCCWAFAAVAAVEGLIKLKTGQLISLSEQQLVDCNTYGTSHGCGGGWFDDAFNYIIQNQGLSKEENYPYQAVGGICDANQEGSPAAQISGYENVPSNSEEALLKAVANQPVSVTVEGAGQAFMFYSGGIFSGACGTYPDHAVAVVGYGTSEDGTKYWLVKNSWGEKWGEGGYMRMQRDVDAPEGLCGIAARPSYPTA